MGEIPFWSGPSFTLFGSSLGLLELNKFLKLKKLDSCFSWIGVVWLTITSKFAYSEGCLGIPLFHVPFWHRDCDFSRYSLQTFPREALLHIDWERAQKLLVLSLLFIVANFPIWDYRFKLPLICMFYYLSFLFSMNQSKNYEEFTLCVVISNRFVNCCISHLIRIVVKDRQLIFILISA